MSSLIRYTRQGEVGQILLNDPDRLNAMGEEMAGAMRALVDELRGHRPRVLVLTGAGRAFSAGGDLEMLERKRATGVERNRPLMLEFYASYLGLLELEVPLVAAVNGHAVGAGAVLACACDVRLADPAARFAFPFARLGLHPGMGATWFVPRVAGAAATELLLTGRMIGAEEA
ncbi:MAG: enoyl-CoA hydratase/isomerase family protein, partial [Candidatus Eremiobacterota bacterium]